MARVAVLVALRGHRVDPVGVAIGFSPRLVRGSTRSFPLLSSFSGEISAFLFALFAFIRFRLPISFSAVLLMATRLRSVSFFST